MSTQPHGVCSYVNGILTVTVDRKRGKKVVKFKTLYAVEDTRPDPRVASPAFTLTKGVIVNGKFVGSKDVYHVSQDEWGPRCDCVDGEIREKRGHPPCKHCKSLQAVGLLPKPRSFPGSET